MLTYLDNGGGEGDPVEANRLRGPQDKGRGNGASNLHGKARHTQWGRDEAHPEPRHLVAAEVIVLADDIDHPLLHQEPADDCAQDLVRQYSGESRRGSVSDAQPHTQALPRSDMKSRLHRKAGWAAQENACDAHCHTSSRAHHNRTDTKRNRPETYLKGPHEAAEDDSRQGHQHPQRQRGGCGEEAHKVETAKGGAQENVRGREHRGQAQPGAEKGTDTLCAWNCVALRMSFERGRADIAYAGSLLTHACIKAAATCKKADEGVSSER